MGGFLLDARLVQPGLDPGSHGMMDYLLSGPLLVILPGSALAAAVGRSLRSGLWACAWAVVLAAPLLFLALWAVPLGVLGAAAGSWRARRRRSGQRASLAPTA